MATEATLKIKCEDTFHRFPLQEQVKYEAIMDSIRGIHPGEVTAKYLDNEGDMCVLCEATFSDFLSMSGAGGGKVVLKLELFPGARAPAAAHQAVPAELEVASPVAAIAGLLQGPKGHFKGKWKGKCKGKSHGKGRGGSDAGADEHDTANHSREGFKELFHKLGASEGRMKQAMEGRDAHVPHHGGHASGAPELGRALWQLHSADMVNPRCVAAVVANSLGDLIAFAAEHAKAIDWAASVKPELARQVMQALLDHAACVEGLEDCAGKMEAALAGVAIPASEVILGLLTALSELAFDARVSFLEALYTSQQERIDGLLDRARPFWASKGKGKCKGKGKAKGKGKQKGKGDVAGVSGRCAVAADADSEACDPGFEQQAADQASSMDCDSQAPTDCDSWAAVQKGKGKAKGKAKGKGKGESECEGRGACANPHCGFQVTWHSTHCCGMCRRTGGKGHGPKCNRVPVPHAERAAEEPPAPGAATADEDGLRLECSLADEEAGGLHANLEWSLVDDPQEVADDFVSLRGAPPGVQQPE